MSGTPAPKVGTPAAVMAAPRPTTNNLSIAHKHSGPFYISPSLFDNKRLRRKRLRWAKALLAAAGFNQQHILQRYKTERRKQNLPKLPTGVTINLLSDDEDSMQNSNTNGNNSLNVSNTVPLASKASSLPFNNGPPPLAPISNFHSTPKQTVPQLYVCSGQAIEVSKVPNITLIPVQNLQNVPATSTPIAQVAPMPRRIKGKRKSQQPKRHKQPTIVNNESIVLSDDSDNEKSAVATPSTPQTPPRNFNNTSNGLHTPLLTVTTSPSMSRSTVITPTLAQKLPKLETSPTLISQPSQSTYPTMLTPYSAQVDEEVTVSLVPRSLAAGPCPTSDANELFPMLPDETTVHTVIANRTYELSLTKLREGLASCGMQEFSNGQQKSNSTRRKGQVVDTPPMVSPTLPPISLKLSSDLSISLISDDEEDDPEQLHRQRLAAETLLQKQPQLMVQQLQMPTVNVLPAGANVSIVATPRRRKLG